MSSAERARSVSVGGVVVDDEGPALLIRWRDNGQWEPPGGVLEHAETVPQPLQREVLEEMDWRSPSLSPSPVCTRT